MRSNSCDSVSVVASDPATAVFEGRGDDGGTGLVIVAGGFVEAIAGGRL